MEDEKEEAEKVTEKEEESKVAEKEDEKEEEEKEEDPDMLQLDANVDEDMELNKAPEIKVFCFFCYVISNCQN